MKIRNTFLEGKSLKEVINLSMILTCCLFSFHSFGQTPIYTNSVEFESHVLSSGNSIDGNPLSSSELEANSGALLGVGSYNGVIELNFPSLVPANQTCYVQIETDENILESLMGGSIGGLLSGIAGVVLSGNQEFQVQAKNGAMVVLEGNSSSPSDFSGEFLKVAVNEFNETFLVITPQQDYQSIRITNIVGSVLGLNTIKSMRVYDPYYVPNALECGRPTYTSYDAEGITLDLLQLNAGATDIHKAIDANLNSHSQLSLGVVTVPSWIEQKVYFEGLSNDTDVFGIRLRTNPSLNIIDLAAEIVIRGQDGAQVQASQTLTSLLTTEDYDSLSNGDPTTVYFEPGFPVDRICIKYSSLLGLALDQFLEVYEIFKIAPKPVYDVSASDNEICAGTSGTLVANTSNPELEIRWYLDSIGGTLVGITDPGEALTTPVLYSDTTMWVASGVPGCPNESGRIPISMIVTPGPDPLAITFDIDPSGYCASDSAIITPTSLIGDQFQWYLDALSTQPISEGMQSGDLIFGIGSAGELIITGVETINSPYTFYAAVQDSVTLCWSVPGETAEATISINDELPPTTTDPSQEFCILEAATLADVQVNELNINWYDANGVSLPTTTELINNTNYYATTEGVTCESSDSLMLTVAIIDEPAPTTSDSTQYFCPTDLATLADLNINESPLNWYDAPGGNLLAPSTTLVNGTTYYATSIGALCESSELLPIAVLIDDLPTPTTDDGDQVFCAMDSPTTDDIQTNESNIIWYLQPTLGSPLPNATPLVDGNTYYAALVSPTCESIGRLEVLVSFEDVAPPTADETIQFFCDPGVGEPVLTIDTIDVNESDIVWYDAPNGGNVIPAGTPLIDGTTYYAAQMGDYCESSLRLMVLANIESVPAPTTSNAHQDFCTSVSPTVADLQVNESNVNWYDSLGNLLPESTLLTDGASYFGSQVGTNCESADQLEVSVSVADQLGAEILGATEDICLSDTLIYTAPSGMSDYQWSIVGGTIVSGGTISSNTVTVVWQDTPIRTIEVAYETMNGCVVNMADAIVIQVISCSDLTISKTVDNDMPFEGDQVVFTITVTNNGTDEFDSISVSENIPSGYTFISYTATNGSYDEISGEWTVLGLTSGASAILMVTVEVNASGDYLNTASINTSAPIDLDVNNNIATAGVTLNCFNVYNEISPNGDGANDVFYIDCIENYSGNSLQIFNRYGNEVYFTTDYANDWSGVANKNGTVSKGEVLPSGTYYYILKVEDVYEGAGWIYIIK